MTTNEPYPLITRVTVPLVQTFSLAVQSCGFKPSRLAVQVLIWWNHSWGEIQSADWLKWDTAVIKWGHAWWMYNDRTPWSVFVKHNPDWSPLYNAWTKTEVVLTALAVKTKHVHSSEALLILDLWAHCRGMQAAQPKTAYYQTLRSWTETLSLLSPAQQHSSRSLSDLWHLGRCFVKTCRRVLIAVKIRMPLQIDSQMIWGSFWSER